MPSSPSPEAAQGSPGLEGEQPSNQTDEEPAESKKQKILAQVNQHLERVAAAQQAEELDTPEEREQALGEAKKQDGVAKKKLKIVQRLQSGVWQGGLGGAGIGAGVGMGLGTVVGTVVGSVASIPTTGIGLLAGAGTGAVHGPWFKLPNGEKQDEKHNKEKETEVEEAVQQAGED